MFLNNQVQITIPMIPMFLYSCDKKKKRKKKRADPSVFKAFQQLQKVLMESSAHKMWIGFIIKIEMCCYESLCFEDTSFKD